MNIKIFDSELRVMRILWEHGEMGASDIARILKADVGWHKNTTYTTIRKLVDKCAIKRCDPKFICKPLISEEQVQKQEAHELGSKLFDGSASALLSAFLSDKKISQSEINRMKDLIDAYD